MDKECSICKQIKNLIEFEVEKRHPTGRGARCLVCKNIQVQERKRLIRSGLAKPKGREKIKRADEVDVDVFDPDMELRRRAANLLRLYGESAYVKAKLI